MFMHSDTHAMEITWQYLPEFWLSLPQVVYWSSLSSITALYLCRHQTRWKRALELMRSQAREKSTIHKIEISQYLDQLENPNQNVFIAAIFCTWLLKKKWMQHQHDYGRVVHKSLSSSKPIYKFTGTQTEFSQPHRTLSEWKQSHNRKQIASNRELAGRKHPIKCAPSNKTRETVFHMV